MQPDEKLEPKAQEINQQLENDADTITLDQPVPEQLEGPQPPPAQSSSGKDDNSQPEASQENKENKSKDSDHKDKPPKNSSGSSEGATVAGYSVADIIQAPVKPPEPVSADSKKETSNDKVKFLIAMGLALFVVGILLIFLFNTLFGLLVLLLGAAAVIISVFGKVK